jgi:hypothetical protein
MARFSVRSFGAAGGFAAMLVVIVMSRIGDSGVGRVSHPAERRSVEQEITTSVKPCGGRATESSVSRAAKMEPYPVRLPKAGFAGLGRLVHLWQCPGAAVEVDYASGIKVLMDVNAIADPKVAWEGVAAEDPSYTYVGTVGGLPALFIDPAKDPSGLALGSVTVVSGEEWLAVQGNGDASVGDLAKVVESMLPVTE